MNTNVSKDSALVLGPLQLGVVLLIGFNWALVMSSNKGGTHDFKENTSQCYKCAFQFPSFKPHPVHSIKGFPLHFSIIQCH